MENIEALKLSIKIFFWITGILLSAIGILAGFVLWYVKKVFNQNEGLDGKISKTHYETINNREAINKAFSALHTSEKSLWEELIKLRRSVVSGTMVLRRRRQEIDQILGDTRGAKDKLEKHEKILKNSIKIHRKHSGELSLIRSKFIQLDDELTLIKTEKINGKGNK